MPPGGVTLPDGRFIPAGTRIGMAIYHIHYNENIFKEPRKFDPDRWMKPASEIEQQLKFMVAFSRGSRSCLGIKYVIDLLLHCGYLYAELLTLSFHFLQMLIPFASLAYMEMYMAVAYIIRRFKLQLVDTTEKDMVWDDMVVPQFHGEFKVMAERRTE